MIKDTTSQAAIKALKMLDAGEPRHKILGCLIDEAEAMAGPYRRLKLKALGWNLLHLRDTLRRRRDVQRRRTIPDKALWHLFEEGIRGPGGDSMVRLNKGLEVAVRHEPDRESA